ncbi:disulfide bond formation protein DsbB [Caldalkalibacillus uzonensis]|uniref:Probable disulfide formation protein n=1 Tax=Caldalkalibacillus uzonensis TaxID=353224 RepID=A0ABU0CLE1_9BACI|nr:disulfide oxidoreductase [Caldalkalibacillus uzonensis]MDQ0337240.1 disulfide bond formation protein DsbB [Caldalkalibacillus uzonensis]
MLSKPWLRRILLEQGLFVSWIIAFTATLGSLYFSEIIGFIPCEYCWYQRILMYPLAIILVIATVKKDTGVAVYVLPLSIMGGSISLFHYLTQKVTFLREQGAACGPIPCNIEYINWFGFVTIPFLALVAFILITIIHLSLFYVQRSASK